jgi:hypothetical protein
VDKNVDYSGFAQKTDPAEIKLVRKLDLHIMVSSVQVDVRLRYRPPSGPCTGSTTSTEMPSPLRDVSHLCNTLANE